MVDFNNPAVMDQDHFVLVKLWHAMEGLFIWEFFITLDYEWSVIQRRRPYRWTIWIHSLTRICTLIAVSINMLLLDTSGPINCQLVVIFELIFVYLAFASASLLIVLRIYAIWERNKIAMAIAVCAWCTNVGFLIHGITELKSTWVPIQNVCAVLNPQSSRNNIVVTLITDVVLCLVMLVGILRLRQHGTLLGLGKLLWRQGLIWLFLATIAEVPPAVFISLNLNNPLDLMFQTPALIIMSIAATRMYRSLTDFTTNEFHSSFGTSQSGTTAGSDPKRISIAPIPLNRVEVSVHRSYENYAPAQTPGQYGTYGTYLNSTDSHSLAQDKSLTLAIDHDPENGAKKG